MTVIHAYRRKEPTTVELFGLSIEFKSNDKKDVVADVDHDEAVDRLLSISEAYRMYADQPLALSRHDEASARLVNALDARVTTLQTQVMAQSSTLASAAVDISGALGSAWQANADGSAEFPGVIVDAAGGTPGDTDGASKGAAQDPAPGDTGSAASPYVFANENGESIDISRWTANEIREFAKENEIELPKGNAVKVGELRDLLAAALADATKE